MVWKMIAQIHFESGVSADHIDAAAAAYEAIGAVAGTPVTVQARPLRVAIPHLNSLQYESEWIERVHVEDPAMNFLVLTKGDLGASGLNFCYGRAAFNRRAAIVSTRRLGETSLTGLVLHEVGHSVGLVDSAALQHNTDSQFGGHCKNVCVMEPVLSRPDMDSVMQKMIDIPRTAGFCGSCVQHLATIE